MYSFWTVSLTNFRRNWSDGLMYRTLSPVELTGVAAFLKGSRLSRLIEAPALQATFNDVFALVFVLECARSTTGNAVRMERSARKKIGIKIAFK